MASKHHLGISTIAINQIHDEIKGMLATAAENVSQSFKAVEEGASEGIRPSQTGKEEIDLSNMRTVPEDFQDTCAGPDAQGY